MVGGFVFGVVWVKVDVVFVVGYEGDVFDVVIVGVGLVGLMVVCDLCYVGCEFFVVFEVCDCVGGCMLNYDVGGGYVIEVGG